MDCGCWDRNSAAAVMCLGVLIASTGLINPSLDQGWRRLLQFCFSYYPRSRSTLGLLIKMQQTWTRITLLRYTGSCVNAKFYYVLYMVGICVGLTRYGWVDWDLGGGQTRR